MQEIALHEAVELGAGLTIDEERGIVYGVKILGAVSKNGFEFPAECRADSHALMEGAFVNWDHRPKGVKEVPLSARFGRLRQVREDLAANCTRADLHYFKGHREAPHFLSMARQDPGACGFSVLGSGEAKKGTDGKPLRSAEGRIIMRRLTGVQSFDLVADAANAMGLRETTEVKPVELETTPTPTETTAAPAVALSEAAPAPAEPAAPEASDDYSAEGCIKAIEQIVMNGQGSAREKLSEIERHLAQLRELEGEEDEEESEEMEESAKAREDARAECIRLCESHGVKDPPPHFLDLLVSTDPKGREPLVKRKATAKKPKSGPPPAPATPLRESATTVPAPTPTVVPPSAETEEQVIQRVMSAFKSP